MWLSSFTTESTEEHRESRHVHQQATSGTHKNLQPCRLPNLFSCQISSSSACADCPASAGSGLLPIQSSTPTLTLTPNFKLALGCWLPSSALGVPTPFDHNKRCEAHNHPSHADLPAHSNPNHQRRE